MLRNVLCIFLALLFLDAESAYAWGAATHLKVAETVLLNKHLFAPELTALLANFSAHFAYGNIIADLILGKRYGIDYRDHSHNWQVGFDLLSEADSEPLQAAMWGYLCHLGADVVAHKVYVPSKLAAARKGAVRGHAGWEIAYDIEFDPAYLDMSVFLDRDIAEQVDPFVMERLRQTIFSHQTNKLILATTLRLQRIATYRRIVRAVSRRHPQVPGGETRDFYFQMTLSAVFDVLKHGKKATVVWHDPTGHQELTAAVAARQGKRFSHDISLHDCEGNLLSLTEIRTRLAEGIADIPQHGFEHHNLHEARINDVIQSDSS